MVQNSSLAELAEKIATYRKLLDKDPHSTIFVPLCETYRRLGRLDEAVAVASRGIRDNPSFPAGYVALGRVRYQQGALEQAGAEFEKALILDKDQPAALIGLARVRFRQKDWEEARKLLEHVNRLAPENAAVSRLLARLEPQRAMSGGGQLAAGEEPPDTDAADGEEEAPAPEPIATVTIAEIYIRQGFPEKALKVYRDLSRDNPRDERLRRKLIDLKQEIEASMSPLAVEPIPRGPLMEMPEVATKAHAMPGTELPESVAALEPLPENPLVDILTRWLDAISRRRTAHVR